MRKKKVLSLKKRRRSILLSSEDLEALNILLKTDLSLNDAFDIIKNKKNAQAFATITERLKNGELIEVIFQDHLEGELKVSFKAFSSYLSFKKTLDLILTIKEREGQLLRNVAKEIAYPLGLLSFSLIGIYLFNSYCFDPLLGSMGQLTSGLDSLYIFKNLLDLAITVVFIVMLVILSMILYFLRPKKMVLAYVILQKYLPNSVLKEYLTSQFVLFFKECYMIGLKTKDSIEVLKHLHFKPLIAFMASNVDKGLLDGKGMVGAMHNPYLDERIERFIKIALYSGEMSAMLEGYLVQFQNRFKRYCQKWSKAIQLLSYCLIGLVIIFIYQILFIPMGIIGGL